MITNVKNTFKGNNKIIQAYENNALGCVLEISPNNPYRLHRFKKKFDVPVTGKEIGDRYVIVFWDRLTNKLGE